MASFSPKSLLRFLPPVLLGVAGWVLWRELHDLSAEEFRAAVAQWGWGRSLAAVALAFLVYGCLSANEQIGLRWAGLRVPLAAGLRNAFVAFAVGNSVGGWPVGAALRARSYARFGVTLGQVAQITAYGTLSYYLGSFAIAGGLLLGARDEVYRQLRIEPFLGHAVGGLMWAGLAVYALAGAFAPERVRLFRFEFKPPRPRLVAIQLLFGAADSIVGSAVAWVLLGASAPPFQDFLSVYIISTSVGAMSGVPGGAGVAEGFMIALLPQVDRAALAAAFLGYRLFYNFAPLAAGLLLLLTDRAGRVHNPAT